MAKFVELHDLDTGERMLVNLEKVSGAMEVDGHGSLVIEHGSQHVAESYEQLKIIIGSAQGGIPMEPPRMY